MGLNRNTRIFVFLLLSNVLLLIGFNSFLNFIGSQNCISISDPIHNKFESINVSRFIFTITYLPVIIFLVFVYNKPKKLNQFAIAYLLLTATRMLSIYLFPLCEPMNAIRLEDPILNSFFYSNGYCALDLFYSGHTATLFIIALMVPKPFNVILMILSIALGILLVAQKVHYTIDVIAAFPIGLFIHYLAKKTNYFISRETKTAK